MNIYKIYSLDERVVWDSYDAHIVAAHLEVEARNMVPHGDEGKATWTDPTRSRAVVIGEGNFFEPEVILSSFNAG